MVETVAPETPASKYPTKVRGRENRARRDLPDRDRVEELRLRQPVQAIHQVGLDEREQHIAAAEQHRADFQEEQEKRHQVERHRTRRDRFEYREFGKYRERRGRAASCSDHNHHDARAEQHHEFIGAEETRDDRRDSERDEDASAQRRAPEPPQRLDDNGDDDRLDSIEQRLRLRQGAEFHIGPCDRERDEDRGDDEA